jgi:hypothetical protein
MSGNKPDVRSRSFNCEDCYDTGVQDSWLDDFRNPKVGSWDGRECQTCGGDPLSEIPHERRPHPPDYDCPNCDQGTETSQEVTDE